MNGELILNFKMDGYSSHYFLKQELHTFTEIFEVMFLQLNHQKLQIYQTSKAFTLACYRLSKQLPNEEKFGMISQIRRAALSVHLNIAEGCSRKSENERKRFYEISRGSLIEVDAAFDIAFELNYLQNADALQLGELIVACFKMLSSMIASKEKD